MNKRLTTNCAAGAAIAGLTLAFTGSVALAQTPRCQLGVLDLSANGGINPNTGLAWAIGDKYRLAFYTSGKSEADNTDPAFYNAFVTDQAKLSTPLAGTSWRAMISTAATNVKENTGTSDVTGGAAEGGAGEPVFVVNGSTCIARNNADIWDAWSNPFAGNAVIRLASGSTNNNSGGTPVVASQNVHYSPYLDQFGLGDSATVHGVEVWTGAQFNGTNLNGQEVGHDPNTNWGSSNANNTARIWNRGNAASGPRSLYAISIPLSIVDLDETVAPALISFVDNRSGASLALGTGSIVYTVTFSEAIDAATLSTADFETAGSASVNIDSIRGTLNPAAFEVIVTPTTAGTVHLRTQAGAVIKDPVGNPMNTSAPVADDTIITITTDSTAPLLVSIEDNVAGAPVQAFSKVTYTVTFDEAMNASTLDTADFGNSGTAPITVNSVAATGNPAVFTVTVTPAGAGTLKLAAVPGATITDLAGNALLTTIALPDDTTLTVDPDPLPTLVSIEDSQSGGPVYAAQSFTCLVTFDQVIIPASVDAADFENGGAPAFTVNAVAATSNPSVFAVHVTPGGPGTIRLQIKAGAVITNVNGTAVNTAAALPDDTAITVNAGSGPARGVITVDSTTSWSGTTASLTGTLNASLSDKLVVIVTGEHGNPGDLSGNCSDVTYDGVSLTRVVDRNAIGGTPFDQTYNDIWYLDNPATSTGSIVATVNSRGNVTAFALSGTAPGAGQSAISSQASKSVVLSTSFANSIVVSSHGMGGDGNTANVGSVDAVAPLTETSARFNGSSWDGHVTGYALIPTPGTATYSFTGGNLIGSHTVAAEFIAAGLPAGTPYATWAQGPFSGNLTDPSADKDFDGGGLATGIEWVVGGDPTTASDDAASIPALDSSHPTNFEFIFKQRDAADADPGTAIVVEYGSDLAGWRNTAVHGLADGVVVDETTSLGGGFHEVTVSIPRTLAVDGSLFARLKVTVAP